MAVAALFTGYVRFYAAVNSLSRDEHGKTYVRCTIDGVHSVYLAILDSKTEEYLPGIEPIYPPVGKDVYKE